MKYTTMQSYINIASGKIILQGGCLLYTSSSPDKFCKITLPGGVSVPPPPLKLLGKKKCI